MGELTPKEKLSVLVQCEPAKVLDPIVAEICCGIEEEELPFSIVKDKGKCLSLAEKAAQISFLGVGVGVDESGAVALAYHRMPPGKAVFSLQPEQGSRANLRLMGVNAARMVKGSPFKAFLGISSEVKTNGYE